MAQATVTKQTATDAFVRQVIQQYRTKLLDLTSRNPLISFKHSERSRNHIRVIDEIPEFLFNKLVIGKQLSFEPLPDPELTPQDESAPFFVNDLRRAKGEDSKYKESLSELGPNASARQKQKIERELRNRVRAKFGWDTFQPTWDPTKRARELGLNPDYELPKMNGQTARRHTDSKIQTMFFSDDLERKLSGLRDAARVLEKDAGFNALYCAFGFLEYYESEQAEGKRLAPLVFIPVSLDRVLVEQQYQYFIKTRNEDVTVNVAVAELLKAMSVDIPAWIENEDNENPLGTYLGLIERAISGKRDWKLRRYVTIGLFTFSTLAMYKDLDPQRWPAEAALEQQPVLRTLIAGAESSNIQYAEDYEIDSLDGPEPLLITDADSSQHSAVVDVLRGKSSQVIQGPPGTGKSQTITNIVSAALNEGLSVLFVAEKMAALEVVKKRLDSAGLEAFCLELHSSKISKTAVTQSLAHRLTYQPPALGLSLIQSNAKALNAAKEELLYYVQRVNDAAGETGLKIYDVLLGSAIRESLRADLPPTIADARLTDSLKISPHTYRQMIDAAATLENQMEPLAVFGKLANHPWRGIQNIEITELDESRLMAVLSEWNDSIRYLLDTATKISEVTETIMPDTRVGLEEFCSRMGASKLPPLNLNLETYKECAHTKKRNLLRQMLKEHEALLEHEAKVGMSAQKLAKARAVGSHACRDALRVLADLGVDQFTVSSIMELKGQQLQLATQMAGLDSFCSELQRAAALPDSTIGSMRAAISAIELLGKLPRLRWANRSNSVLDQGNRRILEKAVEQCDALRRRRTEVQSVFDLQLLPPVGELRRSAISLKTSNSFSMLFSSACRDAKRMYRSIAQNKGKMGRPEMAAGLLRCAQYLTDSEAFIQNSELKMTCGVQFAGLETQFDELLNVAEWADEVRKAMAIFSTPGIRLRDFLFNAEPDQLEKLAAIGRQSSFSSLTGLLEAIIDDDYASWSDLVQKQRIRADKLSAVADVLEKAGLENSCSQSGIKSIANELESIEQISAEIALNKDGLELVGGTPNSLRADYEPLDATLSFADAVSSWNLPTYVIEYFFADPSHIAELQSMVINLKGACSALNGCQEKAKALAHFDPVLWCGAADLERVPVQEISKRNQRALDNFSALRDYLNFLLAENAASNQGLGPVLSAYSGNNLDYYQLSRAVEFVFYRSAAEMLLKADPRLRTHSGATHQQLRKQFQSLDREYIELRRKQLATSLTHRPCPSGNSFGPVAELTEYALVARVAGQTRPRITVRDLISRAGKAMQALKPCWMMSPMSVAQYLDPGNLQFDLVIMDEASQIRPEEALGGIARGKKAVVVGDQMQLPPTPFFQKLSAGSATDDDEFDEETKQDSVLEAAAGRFHPSRRLKWHYRSEHGSLISFSNAEFYDNQLTVFPSPYYDHPEFGVSLVQTGGVYEAGLNENEGNAVVEAAIDFMKKCPKQSLGIVAINAKQTEFIREQLDRAVATDTQAAAYVQSWDPTLESLFVKNLENVQGDERDVIFISTVYGKDKNGSFYQRFGPINGIYGHRRLNVLFTRAKKRVAVFTSMCPEDIQEEGKHWGVKALKGYLKFARDGLVSLPTGQNGDGEECESEFEQWVLEVLRTHGYQGVPQVGVCGYRIDIGVRHPSKPGVFLCGVECDGATYHSARSVRERDRLRQEILEKYGWKLYRIWSTDWFRNPKLQTSQLLSFLKGLHLQGRG